MHKNRFEHSPGLEPKPLDLVNERIKTLFNLEGVAWTNQPENRLPDWEQVVINDAGDMLWYNRTRIAFIRQPDFNTDSNDPAAYLRTLKNHFKSWHYLGTLQKQPRPDQNGHHFITARLRELTYPKISGVKLDFISRGNNFNDNFILRASNLRMDVYPFRMGALAKYPWYKDQSYDTIAETLIQRENPNRMSGTSASFGQPQFSRQPELAQADFLRQFKAELRQLYAMGFTRITGQPTDERRVRIYNKMGMRLINHEGITYTDLDLKTNPLVRS